MFSKASASSPTERKLQSPNNTKKVTRKRWKQSCIFAMLPYLILIFLLIQAKLFIVHDAGNLYEDSFSSVAVASKTLNNFLTPRKKRNQQRPLKIAYAISITKCEPPANNGGGSNANNPASSMLDGAAVLAHSIHLNSIRSRQSQSKYDYEMIAFIHPEGINCTENFQNLGYKTMLKETPVNVSDIQSTYYQERVIQGGCCQEKEYLKLYTWTLTDYPVAVHLDTDSLILKPMDNLFDAMLHGRDTRSSSEAEDQQRQQQNIRAMWIGKQDNWFENITTARTTDTTTKSSYPTQIDAFFTRDYNMINPSHFFNVAHKQPKHVGVQGGFIAVRPSLDIYQELRQQVLIGNFTESKAWGGLGFGGFYGDQTIQGLWTYYYGHLISSNSSGGGVELNRCFYNQMADNPIEVHPKTNKSYCRTGVKLDECEDCRTTNFQDIYSIHLTVCGKPWWCPRTVVNVGGNQNKNQINLCGAFLARWYEVRQSLQSVWDGNRTTSNTPYNITMNYTSNEWSLSYRQGICGQDGNGAYIPLRIPSPYRKT